MDRLLIQIEESTLSAIGGKRSKQMNIQSNHPSQVRRLVRDLWETRAQTLSALAGLDPARLDHKVPWHGEPAAVRYHLIRLADDDYERLTTIRLALNAAGWRPTETQLLMAETEEARGGTLALLAGLPDARLDEKPAAEEWSVRQTIGHIHAVERRYTEQADYAVRRYQDGERLPLVNPTAGPPQHGVEVEGSVADIRGALLASRERVNEALAGVSDDLLVAPTKWGAWIVDTRFRPHRFPAHEREHQNQIRKALQAVGYQPNEVAMLLGQAEMARAKLAAALIGVPDELLNAKAPTGVRIADELISAAAGESALVATLMSFNSLVT